MAAESDSDGLDKGTPLRRGWTTGACATAATKSALGALLGDGFADPVTITLPGGQTPAFALCHEQTGDGFAAAGIIKDAGDDPDVTHGATIISTVRLLPPGQGIRFTAGEGVGKVTKPGLPLAVGEPAINPVPRQMMTEVIGELCGAHGRPADVEVTISVPGGEALAAKTWNPRLGIIGGLSILGTTGIVVPYSCSAWIHSIHRGIDVARAIGLDHVVGSTGDASERAARALLGLPDEAFIDMGDFVGGMLKYLRAKPVRQVTIAGGFGKLSKLAEGAMDLHSGRSQVNIEALAHLMTELGAAPETLAEARSCETAAQVLALARAHKIALANRVAELAGHRADAILGKGHLPVQLLITDRQGKIVGRNF